MKIDPRHTFRMVIAGSANQPAIALARRAVSQAPLRPNPLLIRGQTGVGKSMLLHAAANDLMRRRGSPAITMLTAEEFSNAYIHGIRVTGMDRFRQAIDQSDALVVDELEDLASRPSAFEELERAIRTFVERGRTVLLATGPAWNEPLEWLMREIPHARIAVVLPPTQQVRLAALQRTCRARRRRLPRNMLLSIARRAETIPEARSELERALIELHGAYAAAGRRKPSLRVC